MPGTAPVSPPTSRGMETSPIECTDPAAELLASVDTARATAARNAAGLLDTSADPALDAFADIAWVPTTSGMLTFEQTLLRP